MTASIWAGVGLLDQLPHAGESAQPVKRGSWQRIAVTPQPAIRRERFEVMLVWTGKSGFSRKQRYPIMRWAFTCLIRLHWNFALQSRRLANLLQKHRSE